MEGSSRLQLPRRSRLQPTTTSAFRQFVKGLSAAELFELEDQLTELSESKGWDALMRMLGEGRENVLATMTSGEIKTHEAYVHRSAYVQGIEEAPNAVQAILDAAARQREQLEREAEAAGRGREEEARDAVATPH